MSVASLVSVLFKTPGDQECMLALERKATLVEKQNSSIVEVSAQPFGGAVRILDIETLYNKVGAFRFDSYRSRDEADFRLFIRPSVWPALREFIVEHLGQMADPVLETGPNRELVEEFEDAMKVKLTPNQYVSKPVGMVIEENPKPTENYHARGYPTVRVYRIFEATILDLSLIDRIIASSNRYTDRELADLALIDAKNGGKGRANGILVLPMEKLISFYSGILRKNRNMPASFEDYRLAETVAVILDGIDVPKYTRL